MPMKNIAFVGKMATGKSYYASLLRAELMSKGININVIHISTKIKDIATELFGMHEKDRDLLQKIAANMREIDEHVWIRYLLSDIRKENKLPFILDDLRFKDEVLLIRQTFDLLIVKIDSDDSYRKSAYAAKYGKAPTEKELTDITETSMDEIEPDLVLKNDYTKQTASSNITKLLKELQVY